MRAYEKIKKEKIAIFPTRKELVKSTKLSLARIKIILRKWREFGKSLPVTPEDKAARMKRVLSVLKEAKEPLPFRELVRRTKMNEDTIYDYLLHFKSSWNPEVLNLVRKVETTMRRPVGFSFELHKKAKEFKRLKDLLRRLRPVTRRLRLMREPLPELILFKIHPELQEAELQEILDDAIASRQKPRREELMKKNKKVRRRREVNEKKGKRKGDEELMKKRKSAGREERGVNEKGET